MTNVSDSLISIKVSTWASFMYDVDEFDEGQVANGLCWGYFLIQVSDVFSLKSIS